jgi:hypothetical protein
VPINDHLCAFEPVQVGTGHGQKSLGTVVAAVVRMVCAEALSQIAWTLSSIDAYSA